MAEPRTASERKADTLSRLERDVDAWVATADTDGPYLVPLSFIWDGTALTFSTPADSPTGRNLARTGRARVAVGDTRDVVMIDGAVTVVPKEAISVEVADTFAAETGFDPRRNRTVYHYFRIVPEEIQAWRESNELTGRVLMRDGRWLVD